jgi:hypothetical protein
MPRAHRYYLPEHWFKLTTGLTWFHGSASIKYVVDWYMFPGIEEIDDVHGPGFD